MDLPAWKNKNILYTSLGLFWVFFGFAAAQQYFVPLLKLQGRASLALTSLLILYIVFLFSGVIAPKIINHYGTKRSLILGAITYGLFSLSIMVNNVPLLICGSILIGFGASLLWVSTGQIITHFSERERVGRNLGFQSSLVLFGTLCGISLGGLLINFLSFQELYLLFSFAIFFGLFFLFKIENDSASVSANKYSPLYLFKPKLLFLFPLIFAAYFFAGQSFSAINLVVLGLYGIGYVAIAAMVYRVSIVLGSLNAGRLVDRYSKEKVIMVSASLGIIGVLLFINTSSLLMLLAGLVFLGLFFSTAYPACLALLREHSPEDEYINYLGSFHVYTNVATVSALVTTKFLDSRQGFEIGLAMLILALPSIFLFQKRYGK